MSEEVILQLTVVKSHYFVPQTTWTLKPGEYILGRFPTSDIVIPDPYVSRRHARIFFRDGKWYIEDIGSTNGTIVNDDDIRGKEPVEIKNGTEIVVGLTILKATILGPTETAASTSEESGEAVEEETSSPEEIGGE